jgi:phosphoribosylaminoimidazole-succinocarboxamide synthase
MPKLSPKRAGWKILPGLELVARGKVRDSYLLPCGKILLVATDAISIFDFVLNALVPMKGVILTAMSVFWFKELEKYGIKHHMVAYGSGIDEYLPEELQDNADLQSRAMVVENLDMVDDTEFIVRGCLTGSGKEEYDEIGMVCGHVLPTGLQDGDELPFSVDTPSTKASVGHDEHVDAATIQEKYPLQTYLAIQIFSIIQAVAKKRGVLFADTKFEFAKDGTLADEVATPDSSRFWSFSEWEASRRPVAERKAPSAFDKQFVRAWGILMGINKKSKYDPSKESDVDKVHAMVVPDEIIAQTTQIYRYIFWRLTRMTIEDYLCEVMNVNIEKASKCVLIIAGSESDLPEIKDAIGRLAPASNFGIVVHVMSCHRNPLEVMHFVLNAGKPLDYDVIIGVGSKALALPGIIDAWANHFNRVAGVALGKPGSEELLAAQLSITQIPGQPVIINEITGEAYTGVEGLAELLNRIDSGELPPEKPRKHKDIQINVSL